MVDVTLEFEYTQDEVVKPTRYYLIRNYRTIGDVVLAIIYLMLGIYFWYKSEKTWATISFIVAALLFLLPVIYVYLHPIRCFQRNQEFLGKRTIRFSEDFIHYRIEYYSETKSGWHFNKVVDKEEYYFLFFTKVKGKFLIIPKRVFENKQQEEMFRQLVQRKISREFSKK